MQREALAAYGAFAAFGAVWGAWGAAVPRVQDQAAVSDGQLGLALLFIGVGALAAMLGAGRVLDRFGLRVTAGFVTALGVVATALTGFATDLSRLCCGLAVLGALSGSADVGINAIAGRAEAATGRRVIARAHGTFSAAVVAASLGSAAATAGGTSLAVPFASAAVVCAAAGGLILVTPALDGRRPGVQADGARQPAGSFGPMVPLVLLGLLGALAFATENAHQSWSAVFARNQLHAGSGPAAVAPAIFAAAVAVSRLTMSTRSGARDGVVLRVGALAATVGALVIAAAPDLAVDAVGLLTAAAGTAVLFPTLLGIVSRVLRESHRGRGTSLVSTVSYVGFLLGPVYVGLWSSLAGLRVAMLAVGALPLLIVALVHPVLRTLADRTATTAPASAEALRSPPRRRHPRR
jgi:MFS family permease